MWSLLQARLTTDTCRRTMQTGGSLWRERESPCPSCLCLGQSVTVKGVSCSFIHDIVNSYDHAPD